jgi:hypothetical protein
MTTKQAVLDMIRRMPDDATLADIMAEIYFRQKVERGIRQLDEGKGIPHARARKRLGKWLK